MAEKLIARLTPEVYDKLVRDVGGNTIVTHQTTELQAGFMLGVQHVLNHIKAGLVIESTQTHS